MEWTELKFAVKTEHTDLAAAIANMVSDGGIMIEDYSDMEQTLESMGWQGYISDQLLNKDRSVSATLQAWAMQPSGLWGGSPPKISDRFPTPTAGRCSANRGVSSSRYSATAFSVSQAVRRSASVYAPSSQGQTVP